jgi:uncharacterized protein
MNKEQALDLLHKHMENKNLRRHCYAVGYALIGIRDYLEKSNMLEQTSPDREVWEVLGILHDSDYELTKEDWNKHTLVTLEWLNQEGISKKDPLYRAIESHNTQRTNLRKPETQMEWALECVDELTGFIVACALVKPDKKLSSVTVDTVLNNWNKKGFAAGVHRPQIEQCEEKLGIPLKNFIEIVLSSMQKHSGELGL